MSAQIIRFPEKTSVPTADDWIARKDINECRSFLRSAGLELRGVEGWKSDNRSGLIQFDAASSEWYATHWET